MTVAFRAAAKLALVGLVLAGCATTRASSQTTDGAAPKTPASQQTTAATPSATARMVCGPEIQGSVRQALSLRSLTPPTATWRDQLYSCVYRLPMGPMTLSVKQSASDAAAKQYFTRFRTSLGRTSDLIGLGEASYGTSAGVVVVVKDDKTLVVDTTKLPVVFGTQQQKRTDLAYEIASDVLGCWTGNDYGSTVSSSSHG